MKKPTVIKKYRILYIESARQRVLEVLFRYPDKEFSLSELAKEAKVAKANIGVILKEFLKMDIIIIEELTNIWRIKANQRNWLFQRAKIIYNLNIIYNSNLIEYIDNHFNHPKAVILFGSFRYGEDISSSDIDIGVYSEEKKYKIIEIGDLSHSKEIYESIGNFEKLINRKVQIHLFNKNNIDLHVFRSIANGIILSGFLEVNI